MFFVYVLRLVVAGYNGLRVCRDGTECDESTGV
jgi:hypothetical protein